MTHPDVVIYHNAECGNSIKALALIRQMGIEPNVIEYVKTPPSRGMLKQLASRMGTTMHTLLRDKDTPMSAFGLDGESVTEDQILDAMEAHPLFIHRPIVVTTDGVLICRPAEKVFDLLPTPSRQSR